MAQATFAAGCFWGVEEAFRQVEGITGTTAGYTAGSTKNPSYRQVCGGRTGHAEAVSVQYDPERVSYEQLLDTFWRIHDPTTRNRQGLDLGSQYRSALFFHTPEQEAAALASRERRQRDLKRPIVTEIVPAAAIYPAEDYHQRYFAQRGIRH